MGEVTRHNLLARSRVLTGVAVVGLAVFCNDLASTERHRAMNGSEMECFTDTHGSAVGGLLLQPRRRLRGRCRDNTVIIGRPLDRLSTGGKCHHRWTKSGLSASFLVSPWIVT